MTNQKVRDKHLDFAMESEGLTQTGRKTDGLRMQAECQSEKPTICLAIP